MERITGPHYGFYIAGYAAESEGASERWLGYVKICRRRPESYWDAACLVKMCGERQHADAGAALADAEARALEQLRRICEFSSDAVAA